MATIGAFADFGGGQTFRQSAIIAVFMSSIHTFRMFGFFLISGYFSALIISKRGRSAWMKDRFNRIAIPLVSSVLTLGILNYYLHAAVYMDETSITNFPFVILHLWFLIVLFAFVLSLYFVPVERIAGSQQIKKAILLQGYPGIALIAGLAIWGLACSALDSVLPYGSGWDLISFYFYHLPAFTIGVFAFFEPVGSRIFTFGNRRHFLAVLVIVPIYICLDTWARPSLGITDPKSFFEKLLSNSLDIPIGLIVSVTVFSLLNKLIQKRIAFIDFLVSGAMAIYIFHMSWVLVVTKALTYTGWPSEVQWITGSLTVFALSVGSYLLVRGNKWLSMAFVGTGPPVKPEVRASLV